MLALNVNQCPHVTVQENGSPAAEEEQLDSGQGTGIAAYYPEHQSSTRAIQAGNARAALPVRTLHSIFRFSVSIEGLRVPALRIF